MENRVLAVVCLSVVLMSCVQQEVQPPAISDISNADSLVRVQARNVGDYWTPKWPPLEAVLDQGGIGCSMFGKPALMLSSRCIATFDPQAMFNWCVVREYLFACRTSEEESSRAKVLLPKAKYIKETEPILGEASGVERKKSDAATNFYRDSDDIPKDMTVDDSDGSHSAAYRDCIRQYPSDWCADWHLTDGVSAGHGN